VWARVPESNAAFHIFVVRFIFPFVIINEGEQVDLDKLVRVVFIFKDDMQTRKVSFIKGLMGARKGLV